MTDAFPPAPPTTNNKSEIKDFLRAEDWPEGLISTALDSFKHISKRYVILDDSGSMSISDGSFFNKKYRKMVTCTRCVK